jgi:hypothetical protein
MPAIYLLRKSSVPREVDVFLGAEKEFNELSICRKFRKCRKKPKCRKCRRCRSTKAHECGKGST